MDEYLNLLYIPCDDPNEMDRRRVTLGRPAMRKVLYIPLQNREYQELIEMLDFIIMESRPGYSRLKDAVIMKEKLRTRFNRQPEIMENIMIGEEAGKRPLKSHRSAPLNNQPGAA